VSVLHHRFATRITALCVLLGHFMAWAQHKTAALTLSGHELATFTNATPHAGIFFNEGFLLPLWASALLFVLRPGHETARANWPWLLLAIIVAALGLPAYPELRKLLGGQASDFMWQLPASVAVMALAVIAQRTAPRAHMVLTALAGIAALVAVAGFFAIRGPALEVLYRDPVIVGFGVWMTLAGGIAALAIAFVTILSTLSLKQRPH
jgi:hypothetical protein